jgi:hypothetical protein
LIIAYLITDYDYCFDQEQPPRALTDYAQYTLHGFVVTPKSETETKSERGVFDEVEAP